MEGATSLSRDRAKRGPSRTVLPRAKGRLFTETVYFGCLSLFS
jgi:hypothetical protein